MRRSVLQNKRGLSLIETMIALLLFLILSVAVMQTSLISIESNLKNELRDEAIRITVDRMEEARNISFDKLSSDPTPGENFKLQACPSSYPVKIVRKIRNKDFSFGSSRVVEEQFGINLKQITIDVGWEYRGECYSHSISSIIKRP